MQTNNWRAMGFSVGGYEHWFVYRLKSVCAPDEAGNRIYKGGQFDTKEEAQAFADELNGVGGAGD